MVIAAPTNVAAKLLAPFDPAFEANLLPVEYSGIAVVSLGYRTEDVADPLTGFGFLVPRSSGLSILGSVWNSSLFPGRAPEGHALLTSFVGGATNPGAIGQSPEELATLVHREISPSSPHTQRSSVQKCNDLAPSHTAIQFGSCRTFSGGRQSPGWLSGLVLLWKLFERAGNRHLR